MRPGYRCVIGNGETIMQIVPGADQLVVEAKVAPNDIAQVAPGAKVIVRIMAGNQRTQPEITGVLNRVSADLAREPQQQNSAQPPPAYYTIRIALPPSEVAPNTTSVGCCRSCRPTPRECRLVHVHGITTKESSPRACSCRSLAPDRRTLTERSRPGISAASRT